MAFATVFDQLLDAKLQGSGWRATPTDYAPWICTQPFLGSIDEDDPSSCQSVLCRGDAGGTDPRGCPDSGSRSDPRVAALDFLLRLDPCLCPDPGPLQLRAAFRRLVRRFHPDQHALASDSVRRACSDQFHAVCEAYRTLTAVKTR